ncbi:MAG: response regulator transcription factor [Vicinamibacterales bacterium]
MADPGPIVRTAASVLLVEDDERLRTRLLRALEERGFEARGAGDRTEALAMATDDSPEYAIVDLRLPDGTGLDVVSGLRAIDPSTRIVVLTGYGSIATAVEAVRLGAADYLTKPADADQIVAVLLGTAQPASGEPGQVEVPSLARVEWEHIQRVLADCGGNISKAARLLGIHRRSLQRKLSKYPVSR